MVQTAEQRAFYCDAASPITVFFFNIFDTGIFPLVAYFSVTSQKLDEETDPVVDMAKRE